MFMYFIIINLIVFIHILSDINLIVFIRINSEIFKFSLGLVKE